MSYICDTEDCNHVGVVMLTGDKTLCKPHFDARCADDDKTPSMSHMFGPSILMIEWDPNMGQAVPDALAVSCAECKIMDFVEFQGDMTHIIGTESLLNAYRLAILQCKIEPFHIMLRYKGKVYEFNDCANFIGGWPKGMAVDNINTTFAILRMQGSISKEKHNARKETIQ